MRSAGDTSTRSAGDQQPKIVRNNPGFSVIINCERLHINSAMFSAVSYYLSCTSRMDFKVVGINSIQSSNFFSCMDFCIVY